MIKICAVCGSRIENLCKNCNSSNFALVREEEKDLYSFLVKQKFSHPFSFDRSTKLALALCIFGFFVIGILAFFA